MSLLATPLESFLTVAAVSNISVAAKRLHLSQPAVTKQLRTLEQALRVKLVQRTARGIRLTTAGELLRDYGKRSANLLDECQLALGELAAGDAGRLSIGAGVTTSMFQLPEWLSVYRQRWPRIDICVRTGSSSSVAELVQAREIDCGFVTSDIAHRELESERLYAEDIVLVVAAEAPYRARVALEDVPLIMFPAHAGFRHFLERSFAAVGLTPHVKMEIDSVEATKSLVTVGLGAAFLPAAAVRRELEAAQLRRVQVLGLSRLRRYTSMLRRKDRLSSTALNQFMRLVRHSVGVNAPRSHR
jgi:DNA-binding transcriptional LysR family regulator